MNSTERIQSIITGIQPDRPPFALTLSLYGARLTDCPLSTYFSDSSRYIEGQITVSDTFSPDVIFGPFAFAHIGAAFGSRIKEFSNQAPVIREHACRRPEELVDLKVPDPDSDPLLLYHRNSISGLATEFSSEKPIAAILPLPIDIPALIMGMDTWLETILFDPEMIRPVMDQIIPFFVELANRIFAEGADFIVSPCAFSSPSIVTRDITINFAVPILKETLGSLNGPLLFHHGGAPLTAHLDLLDDLPSVIGYVVDAEDDLAITRSIIGPELLLLGGPDNLSLSRLTPDEVCQWCSTVLNDRKGDRRFMLANSGPDIPLQTPPENIHAFRISVEKYAGEP